MDRQEERIETLAGSLLAVDVGIRTGFAVFEATGKLIRFGSHNYGSVTRLRQAVWRHLAEIENLKYLVLEGGGRLATIWQQVAEKQEVHVLQLYAETWRKDLLYPREQRNGKMAKSNADDAARKIIRESKLPLPSSLRHDAAEAILVGKWAILYGNIGQEYLLQPLPLKHKDHL